MQFIRNLASDVEQILTLRDLHAESDPDAVFVGPALHQLHLSPSSIASPSTISVNGTQVSPDASPVKFPASTTAPNGTKNGFTEIRQIAMLLLSSNPNEYLDPMIRRKRYYLLRSNDLAEALRKVRYPIERRLQCQDLILLIR